MLQTCQYSIVKHHWSVINDSGTLEAKILGQTWEFQKSENNYKIADHKFSCLARNRCSTVVQTCQYSIVKHHWGVINDSWSVEAEIITQTWEFWKSEQKSDPWYPTLARQELSPIYVSEALLVHASSSDIDEGSDKGISRSYRRNIKIDRLKGGYAINNPVHQSD